jgi:hypothetical protein
MKETHSRAVLVHCKTLLLVCFPERLLAATRIVILELHRSSFANLLTALYHLVMALAHLGSLNLRLGRG